MFEIKFRRNGGKVETRKYKTVERWDYWFVILEADRSVEIISYTDPTAI